MDAEQEERIAMYRAYKEARVDRYREYAANARARASASFAASDRIASFIPMGQPILVGHHSEKRHRADIARIHRAMDRGCEEHRKAAYWAGRAASAEGNTAISSRDPEAIPLLKARIAVLEARQAKMKAVNAAHKRFLKDPASLDKADLSDATKDLIRGYKPAYSWEPHPIAPYSFTNLGGNIRRLKGRLEEITRRAATPAAEDITLANGTRIVEDAERDSVNVEFIGKPSEATRTKLKSFGFRWSRAEGVWYARRSNRATYAIRELFPELKPQG